MTHCILNKVFFLIGSIAPYFSPQLKLFLRFN